VDYVLSYNDVTEDKSESFYHAFVLGILVNIDKEFETPEIEHHHLM